jgi:mannitol/fructose-specific phosphotransferase system IIA component (Ntr-type)
MGIEGEELSKTGKINKSSFATIVFNRINSSQTILGPGWLNELGSWIA